MLMIRDKFKRITNNFIKKIKTAEDLRLLKQLIQPLLGELCWLAKVGYGDELRLHCGAKIPYTHPKMKHLHKGEWILGTRASYWELESNFQMITNAKCEIEEIEDKVKIIENYKITDFNILYPSLISIVTLDDKYQLKIFPDNNGFDLPYWELFTPYNELIRLEAKSHWSCVPSNIFLGDNCFNFSEFFGNLERVSTIFLTTEILTTENVREFLINSSLSLRTDNRSLQEDAIQNLIDKLQKGCYLLEDGLEAIHEDRTSLSSIVYYNSVFNTYVYNGFKIFAGSLIADRSELSYSNLQNFIDLFAIDLQKDHLDAFIFRPIADGFLKEIDSIAYKNKTISSYKDFIVKILGQDKFSLEDFVKLAKITNAMIERGIFLEKNSVSLEDYRVFIQHLSIALALCVTIACETIALFTPETIYPDENNQ